MKEKDILDLEIVSTGMNGEGVARQDGLVIFVPLALIGEKVRVQIVEAKKKFATAKVIKILEKAPCRTTPLCPIFYKCGGCEMQHMLYPEQLQTKRANLIGCFTKECGFAPKVDDVVYGEKQFGYRNKAQVPLAQIGETVVAGYYKPNSHTIVPFGKVDNAELGYCPLHSRKMHEIIDLFCNFVQEKKLSIYCENTHTGLVRHIVVRQVGEIFAITIVLNGTTLPFAQELVSRLKTLTPKFSLNLSTNDRRTNVIMGERIVNLYGGEKIQGTIDGIKFAISPLSFFQVNDEIRDKIYSKVTDIIAQTQNSVVIEAYSGIGILSNLMAKFTNKLYGLEIVPDAIKDADELALSNGNEKIIVNICGDVAVTLPKLIAKLSETETTNSILVLDPPRKGCSSEVLQSILTALPNKIVYISCNPATLARDVKVLLESYEISSISPYDMFPQTASLETLACLTRKN